MPFSSLKQIAAAVALVGAMGVANATVYQTNFGTLTGPVSANVNDISGSFDNLYSFSLASTGVTGSLYGFDALGSFDGLFQFGYSSTLAGPVTWSTTQPFGSVDGDADGVFAYTGQASGLNASKTYWIHLSGSAEQGAYSLTLAPVPEPESYALLLAGLGLMGTIVRRRNVAKASQGV